MRAGISLEMHVRMAHSSADHREMRTALSSGHPSETGSSLVLFMESNLWSRGVFVSRLLPPFVVLLCLFVCFCRPVLLPFSVGFL